MLAVDFLSGFENWIGGLSEALKNGLQNSSDPYALVIFFAAGVLTSLTPCVYPMIPIVVAFMGGAETAAVARGASAEGRRARVMLRALVYVIGMAVVYTALGLTAILLGKRFGGLTQNFWGYAFVAVVIGVFGVSLLGLFEIRVPTFILTRLGTGPRQGWLGAALMGATSAIVAAPCAAPIVFPLAAIIARDGRVVFGTIAMVCFSLGLGLLFLVLGISSGMAASLPRPGTWMVTLKKALGVVMIVIALVFLYKGYKLW